MTNSNAAHLGWKGLLPVEDTALAVTAAEFGVLSAQPLQFGRLIGGAAGSAALVDLRLADPGTQCLHSVG
ncbi:hypothetical protein ABZ815_49190 [Nonomuraea sp. NPDC047529]|uniref:hypothetical protein n=1 Tax=Nonomuraea sp. NPDC047529 TaxID=3155623 RepID=UPI0033EFB4DD